MWNAFWSFQPTAKSGLGGVTKALSEEHPKGFCRMDWETRHVSVLYLSNGWRGKSQLLVSALYLYSNLRGAFCMSQHGLLSMPIRFISHCSVLFPPVNVTWPQSSSLLTTIVRYAYHRENCSTAVQVLVTVIIHTYIYSCLPSGHLRVEILLLHLSRCQGSRWRSSQGSEDSDW